MLRFCHAKDEVPARDMANLIIKSLMFYTGQPQEGVSGRCNWPCTVKTFDVQHTRLGNAGASKLTC
jgi:hypothetical protein